jgi:Ca2+-binding RTX toxin-like protein
MARARVKGIALGFAFALAIAGPAQAAPGDIYVSDEDASAPVGNGGIFKFGPNGGPPTGFITDAEFGDPTGLAMYPDGRLVMIDSGANVMFFVDPASGAVTNVGDGGGLLGGLSRDLAITADRKVLVAVEDTEDVVRYDPATGDFSTFADLPVDSQLRTLATTRDGGAFVGADPVSPDGAIYRVSPEGIATPFLSSAELDGMRDMTISPDERTLFVATSSTGEEVIAVDTQTRGVSVRATGDAPNSAALRPDGSLIYSDGGVDGLFLVPAGTTTGTLFADVPAFTSFVNDVVIEPEPPVSSSAPCAGLIPTVVGTTGSDVLLGSVFPDVFLTLGGNDEVRGLAGDDVVCAGDGRDSVYGGPGRDQLFGGTGKDRLRGKAGRDRLLGEAGKDLLVGGKGKDRLLGGKGKDKLKQ